MIRIACLFLFPSRGSKHVGLTLQVFPGIFLIPPLSINHEDLKGAIP